MAGKALRDGSQTLFALGHLRTRDEYRRETEHSGVISSACKDVIIYN